MVGADRGRDQQARKRLGREVLTEVFERVARSVTDHATRGRELRVVAGGHRRVRRGPTRHPRQRRRVRLRRIGGQRLAVSPGAGGGVAECGTHAFLAAALGSYTIGEKTLANRL